MKSFLLQLLLLGALLALPAACIFKKNDVSKSGPVIETAIPYGLVPGSALTLKGRDFGTVQSVEFANVSVAAASFIRTATNEVTLKVPVNAQAGAVKIVNENGSGEAKSMTLLTTGAGLTTDNISTNATPIAQSTISDQCLPSFFAYCYKGACVAYLGADTNIPTCNQKYYTVETIGGSTYQVYKPQSAYPQYILKLETKSGGGYTGFALIQAPNGDTYAGNSLKNNDLVGYSLKDGSELKLCQLNVKNGFPSKRDVICQAYTCPACQ